MSILLFPKNTFLETEFLLIYTFSRLLIYICLAFDPPSLENIASKIAPYLVIETSDQVLLYQPRLQVTHIR